MMVSIPTILKLGAVLGAIVVFVKLGGASGIGSKIGSSVGGGLNDFGVSLGSSFTSGLFGGGGGGESSGGGIFDIFGGSVTDVSNEDGLLADTPIGVNGLQKLLDDIGNLFSGGSSETGGVSTFSSISNAMSAGEARAGRSGGRTTFLGAGINESGQVFQRFTSSPVGPTNTRVIGPTGRVAMVSAGSALKLIGERGFTLG